MKEENWLQANYTPQTKGLQNDKSSFQKKKKKDSEYNFWKFCLVHGRSTKCVGKWGCGKQHVLEPGLEKAGLTPGTE